MMKRDEAIEVKQDDDDGDAEYRPPPKKRRGASVAPPPKHRFPLETLPADVLRLIAARLDLPAWTALASICARLRRVLMPPLEETTAETRPGTDECRSVRWLGAYWRTWTRSWEALRRWTVGARRTRYGPDNGVVFALLMRIESPALFSNAVEIRTSGVRDLVRMRALAAVQHLWARRLLFATDVAALLVDAAADGWVDAIQWVCAPESGVLALWRAQVSELTPMREKFSGWRIAAAVVGDADWMRRAIDALASQHTDSGADAIFLDRTVALALKVACWHGHVAAVRCFAELLAAAPYTAESFGCSNSESCFFCAGMEAACYALQRGHGEVATQCFRLLRSQGDAVFDRGLQRTIVWKRCFAAAAKGGLLDRIDAIVGLPRDHPHLRQWTFWESAVRTAFWAWRGDAAADPAPINAVLDVAASYQYNGAGWWRLCFGPLTRSFDAVHLRTVIAQAMLRKESWDWVAALERVVSIGNAKGDDSAATLLLSELAVHDPQSLLLPAYRGNANSPVIAHRIATVCSRGCLAALLRWFVDDLMARLYPAYVFDWPHLYAQVGLCQSLPKARPELLDRVRPTIAQVVTMAAARGICLAPSIK